MNLVNTIQIQLSPGIDSERDMRVIGEISIDSTSIHILKFSDGAAAGRISLYEAAM